MQPTWSCAEQQRSIYLAIFSNILVSTIQNGDLTYQYWIETTQQVMHHSSDFSSLIETMSHAEEQLKLLQEHKK